MPETVEREPKLLIPRLESFYDVAIPLAWPIIRFAVGWNLLVHGWGKVTRGPSAYVRPFMEQGFDPALPWVWGALIIEFVGGIALILGLFTRFFAAAGAVEMLIITLLYWKAGFSWGADDQVDLLAAEERRGWLLRGGAA